jgi:hypothetical protein
MERWGDGLGGQAGRGAGQGEVPFREPRVSCEKVASARKGVRVLAALAPFQAEGNFSCPLIATPPPTPGPTVRAGRIAWCRCRAGARSRQRSTRRMLGRSSSGTRAGGRGFLSSVAAAH